MTRGELTTELDKSAAGLRRRLEKSVADPLRDVWGGLGEPNKLALRNALLGALIGGVGGAGYGAAAGEGEDQTGQALRTMLTGAALGGTAGGASTVGLNMLRGKTKLPGERDPSKGVISGATNSLGNVVIGHPGAIAGAAGGGYLAAKKGPSAGNLLKLMKGSPDVADQAIYKDMLDLAKQKPTPGLGRADIWQLLKGLGQDAKGAPGNIGRAAGGATGVMGKLRALAGAGHGEVAKVLQKIEATSGKSLASQLAAKMPAIRVPSKAWWAAAPLALGAGYLTDKYIKGDY